MKEYLIIDGVVLIYYLGTRFILNMVSGEHEFKHIVHVGLVSLVSVILGVLLNTGIKNFYHPALKFMVVPFMAIFCGTLAIRIFKKLKDFKLLLYFNTLTCGIILLVNENGNGLLRNFWRSILDGLGFMLMLVVVWTVYTKINNSNIPASYKGKPVILIIMGIISLIVFGLK